MEPLIREIRHQQRHGVGGPLRLPTLLSTNERSLPRQLPEVGDVPEVRRHGDAGVHGARCHGKPGHQFPPHDQRQQAERHPEGFRLRIGYKRFL